jgi:prefoldin alpha subunit
MSQDNGSKSEDNERKKQEVIQHKFRTFQGMNQQMEELKEHISKVSSQIEQISEVQESIKEIHGLKQDTEILVPISSGVFIKANISDNKNFIANVGASTVITQDLEGINSIMDEQKKELIEVQSTMVKDMAELENRAISLQSELKSLIE